MQQGHRAEIASKVHLGPGAAGAATRPSIGPADWHVTVVPRGTAAEDVSRHRDTPGGDLAFLARFAFGRY